MPNYDKSLKVGESWDALPLVSYSDMPDPQSKFLNIIGSTFRSVLYVTSIDPGATITVKYYGQSTGEIDSSNMERRDLQMHQVIDDTFLDSVPSDRVGNTDAIRVTRIQNRIELEYQVQGGNATFGIKIFVLSSDESEINEDSHFEDPDNDNLVTERVYSNRQTQVYNEQAFNETFEVLNGSNDNMNVDGSVTPVIFEYQIPAIPSGYKSYIKSVAFVMVFDPINSYLDYGNIAELANGVLVEMFVDGDLKTLGNFKSSADWAMFFSEGPQIAQGGNRSEGQISGIANFDKIEVFEDDIFQVTIRDNLTALSLQKMRVGIRTVKLNDK